jgi:hypothetical protein
VHKEIRSLLFVSLMAIVLGLIFTTPFGIVWGIITFAGLAITEALLNHQINMLLWSVLWYLVTVEILWVVLIKKELQPSLIKKMSK